MKLTHLFYPVITIALFACGPAEAPEKPQAQASPADQLQQTLTDTTTTVQKNYSTLTEDLLKEESMGGFKIGMPFREKLKGWSVTPKQYWEGDGLVHQSYINKVTADEINICSDDSAFSNAIVSSVTAGPLSGYKTSRNIGIGNTYQEVLKAYNKYINDGETNDTLIVAGSIYGGMIFNFEKGKVARMFMGAAAE